MKILSYWCVLSLLLALACCADEATLSDAKVGSPHEESTNAKDDASDDEDERQRQVLQETLAAGRGHRDTVGVRDQWSSKEHLHQKYDSRQPPSARVQQLLDQYRLDCEGCDHQQAVAAINAFVKQTKAEAAERAQQQLEHERRARFIWWGRVVLLVGLSGVTGILFFRSYEKWLLLKAQQHQQHQQQGLGAAQKAQLAQEQRAAAEARERERLELEYARSQAPTWREREEQEIWTDRQEDQFARALVSFGGVPAKARYTLIADKVDGKNKLECQMHHKLLLARMKDE